MEIAKVIRSAEGLVVVLPRSITVAEGRFEVRQEGDSVRLTPVSESWTWLDGITGEVDEDFVKAANDRPVWRSKDEV